MKTLRALLAVAVLGVGLAGCGGGDARAEVEQAFKGYQTALLARDFPTACGYNAPESTQKLIASVATQGIQASTCEEALAEIYAESGAAEFADTIGRTYAIQDVQVDGDEATITWTATVDGSPDSATIGMRRIDGGWKLATAG